MNRSEIIKLGRLVKACCPSQQFDEYTPDAWTLILAGYNFDDAKAAVSALASTPLEPGKSRYIEPGHIIAGILRIRAKRLEATPLPSPPAGLDSAGYLSWERRTREAIASGHYVPSDAPPAIPAPGGLAELVRSATPKPILSAVQSAPRMSDEEIEAERQRQLAALEALTGK